MRRVNIGECVVAAFVFGGCADPQCPQGELKVGMQCVQIDGADADDEDGGSGDAAADASGMSPLGVDAGAPPTPSRDAGVDDPMLLRDAGKERLALSCSQKGACAEWPMPDRDGKATPSYDSTPDVVRDNVTKLVWQRNLPLLYPGCSAARGDDLPNAELCTWQQARDYCDKLVLDASNNWRLPTVIELQSILNYTRSPAIDTTLFGGVEKTFLWTSPLSVSGSESVWVVGIAGGSLIEVKLASAVTLPGTVRCVRGASTSGADVRYLVDQAADEVEDVRTGLIWQRSDGPARTREAANASCAARGSGWRIPTYKELLTLLDVSRSAPPLLDTVAFPGARHDQSYWSSTLFEGESVTGWFVASFGYYTRQAIIAPSGVGTGTDSNYVRCVR